MFTLAITFDDADPARTARFWAALLGRELTGETTVAGDETQVELRFRAAPEVARTGLNRLHLHVTSTSLADQLERVEQALGLGANHLDVGQRPEEGHIVLADPAGNEFCVIEPGNKFLAGCGLLGEVACDGNRAVGLFWSAALGWPLVWDQDEETAIQSPYGGTKVAWGGPPVAPRPGVRRQRFELTTTGGDRAAGVERLVSLGAARLGSTADGGVLLADPDGNEFSVR
ncbi:VOC family protein [Actinoplanes sp. N902-109]|uniref:VOC family protein n=1 Tax=Actinoplanes sp. (strain N902-109) TaxID=649831 RepID=UPI00032940B1|nr:VOC family protein [Actinoplanes sp. N902-109]AGL18385.1 putative fusion protein [Actinoplanes sp. N902-109]